MLPQLNEFKTLHLALGIEQSELRARSRRRMQPRQTSARRQPS